MAAKTFTVTVTSKSGNSFTIAKAATGLVTRSCSAPGGNDGRLHQRKLVRFSA